MPKKISRRKFIEKSTALGAAAVIGGNTVFGIVDALAQGEAPKAAIDLAVINGTDYFANTIKAVELIGGMGQFVAKGVVVGLNINAVRKTPGTNVKPEIILAVMKMCHDAGAKELIVFKEFPGGFWDGSAHSEEYADPIKALKFSSWKCRDVEIPDGKIIKEARVIPELLDCDVYINMPIVKHHDGPQHTGALKNIMGATTHNPTNRLCHMAPDATGTGFYADVERLTQCIADLNLMRKPDLCISDATEFITTNGPYGPGKLKKLDKIIAGTDPVAMDSFCAGYLDLDGPSAPTVVKAAAHGLGEPNYKKLTIKEIAA